ncbi:MAG: hypothetical protein PUC71_02335 [Oscillospiraceae bacterium]|nr:hypothetical protein [Oscillospiraceae bacterium]
MNNRGNSNLPFILAIVFLAITVLGILGFGMYCIFSFGDAVTGQGRYKSDSSQQRTLVDPNTTAPAGGYNAGGTYGGSYPGATRYPAGDIRNTTDADPRTGTYQFETGRQGFGSVRLQE